MHLVFKGTLQRFRFTFTFLLYLLSLSQKSQQAAIPARSFGEDDVVVVLRSSFDERDTSVVFPVPHRLLEQSLVSACDQSTQSTDAQYHSTDRKLRAFVRPLLGVVTYKNKRRQRNKAIVHSILRPRCALPSPFPGQHAFSVGKKTPSRR